MKRVFLIVALWALVATAGSCIPSCESLSMKYNVTVEQCNSVKTMYNSLLNRPAYQGGDTGLEFWLDQLGSGELTMPQIVGNFVSSREFVAKLKEAQIDTPAFPIKTLENSIFALFNIYDGATLATWGNNLGDNRETYVTYHRAWVDDSIYFSSRPSIPYLAGAEAQEDMKAIYEHLYHYGYEVALMKDIVAGYYVQEGDDPIRTHTGDR